MTPAPFHPPERKDGSHGNAKRMRLECEKQLAVSTSSCPEKHAPIREDDAQRRRKADHAAPTVKVAGDRR